MEKKEVDIKMSLEQKETLVNYLLENREMCEGRSDSNISPATLKEKWEDLARQLNSCTTGDKSKTVAGWKKTWRDIKSYTKRKYLGLTVSRHADGKKELTDLELKILSLMSFLEGHEVSEIEGPIIISSESIAMDDQTEKSTPQQDNYKHPRPKTKPPRKKSEKKNELDIKMSYEQKEILVNYLVAHREMTDITISPQLVKDKWEDLTRQLNTCSSAGKPKTVAGWKKSWRDLRSYIRRKYLGIMAIKRQSGDNGPPSKKELTQLELNVVNLMGLDGHQNKYTESVTFQQPTFDELMVISEVECEDASPSLSFVKCTLGVPQDHSYESNITQGNTAQRRDRGRRYLPKRRNQGSYTLSPVKRALSRTRKRHDSLEIDNRILKYLRNMDLHRKRMEDIQERMATSLESISREVIEIKSDIHRMVNFVIEKGGEVNTVK